MCGAHAAVRTLVAELVEQNRRPTVIDMEAGLEHLSRGTVRHADGILIVVEPYFKSMETGARMTALARELGIGRVHALANKLRSASDKQALEEFCRSRNMSLLAQIPYDESFPEAERAGQAPLDFRADSPAIVELQRLVSHLEPLFKEPSRG